MKLSENKPCARCKARLWQCWS